MNTMYTVVAMETIHHECRPNFVHLYQNSLLNNDIAFDCLPCSFHQTLLKVENAHGDEEINEENGNL